MIFVCVEFHLWIFNAPLPFTQPCGCAAGDSVALKAKPVSPVELCRFNLRLVAAHQSVVCGVMAMGHVGTYTGAKRTQPPATRIPREQEPRAQTPLFRNLNISYLPMLNLAHSGQ